MDSKAQKAVDVVIQAAKDAVITAVATAVTDPQHALLTALAAGGVSGIWGLLEAFSESDKKRIDNFGNDLLLALKNLPEEKLIAVLNQDPYRTLIRKVIFAVYQEHNNEKIQCFRRLLVNVANDQPSDMDVIHYLEGILERLSIFHIRVLRVLWNPSTAAQRVGLTEKSDIGLAKDAEGRVIACLPQEDQGAIASALAEIQMWKLAKLPGVGSGLPSIHDFTYDAFVNRKHLTTLGERLVYLILSNQGDISGALK